MSTADDVMSERDARREDGETAVLPLREGERVLAEFTVPPDGALPSGVCRVVENGQGIRCERKLADEDVWRPLMSQRTIALLSRQLAACNAKLREVTAERDSLKDELDRRNELDAREIGSK